MPKKFDRNQLNRVDIVDMKYIFVESYHTGVLSTFVSERTWVGNSTKEAQIA